MCSYSVLLGRRKRPPYPSTAAMAAPGTEDPSTTSGVHPTPLLHAPAAPPCLPSCESYVSVLCFSPGVCIASSVLPHSLLPCVSLSVPLCLSPRSSPSTMLSPLLLPHQPLTQPLHTKCSLRRHPGNLPPPATNPLSKMEGKFKASPLHRTLPLPI